MNGFPYTKIRVGGWVAMGVIFAALAGQGRAAESPTSAASCLDLSKHYTAKLTDSLNSPASVQENNLASLPKGRQVFSGVPFEVGGVAKLSGRKNLEWGRSEYPESVKGIKVEWSVRQIHLLHGAGGVYDRDGTTIGKLVVHYRDKTVREIEIQTGVHVRDWWGDPRQAVFGENSELAWQGTNPALKKYGGPKPGSLRIYKTTFENPQPEVAVTAIDLVSMMKNSAPFVLAISVE